MRQLTINIPDAQYRFFRKLLQQLPWAEVQQARKVTAQAVEQKGVAKLPILPPQNAEEQAWVDHLRAAFDEVGQHTRGEIQLQDVREFLREF